MAPATVMATMPPTMPRTMYRVVLSLLSLLLEVSVVPDEVTLVSVTLAKLPPEDTRSLANVVVSMYVASMLAAADEASSLYV